MNRLLLLHSFILVCIASLLSACAEVMTITLDSKVDEPVYKYMQHISKKIEIIGVTRYPDMEAMLATRESLELAMKISHAGKLDSVQLIKPANNEKLNQAILDIIQYSAPYPPLPDELKVDYLVIHKRWQFDPH